MLQLSRLKLATRLLLGFGVVLLLALVASGTSLLKLSHVHDALEDVVLDNNVKIRLNHDLSDAVHVAVRQVRNVVLEDNPQAQAQRRQLADKAREDYDKAWADLQKFAASEKGRALRQAIEQAQQKTVPMNNQVMDLALADKRSEAVKLLLSTAAPAAQAWQDAIRANIDFQDANNTTQFAQAQADYQAARQLLMGMAVVNLLASVGLVTLLMRSVVGQLGAEPGEVAELANRIAGADLSTTIALKAGDQTSVMAAMARMQQQLTAIVGAVRGNADGVATASAQIAHGTQDLSSRTEEQASALEQTAATMEQLGSTVRNNAEAARQASQLAQGASTVAANGGQVVGEVVTTMKDISDSSRRIMDIIGVIDGIAFQTNILALNAAVEAARAGEQGRGFAVVAGEVRTLAQRSAEAAREIKRLITASGERVEQGTQLVDRAGQTMTEIVTSIRRVSDLIAEIASASVEQSSGVAQVGEAVTQMDHATQQNAALVEESAAAAESLKLQAGQLVEAVSVFRLGTDGARRPAGTPAARQTTTSRSSKPRPTAPSAAAWARSAVPAAVAADWQSF